MADPAKVPKIMQDEFEQKYVKNTKMNVELKLCLTHSENSLLKTPFLMRMVVTLTKENYIKRVQPKEFRRQERGGQRKNWYDHQGRGMKSHCFATHTNHDRLQVFTNTGRVFQVPVHELPKASRQTRELLCELWSNFHEMKL